MMADDDDDYPSGDERGAGKARNKGITAALEVFDDLYKTCPQMTVFGTQFGGTFCSEEVGRHISRTERWGVTRWFYYNTQEP